MDALMRQQKRPRSSQTQLLLRMPPPPPLHNLPRLLMAANATAPMMAADRTLNGPMRVHWLQPASATSEATTIAGRCKCYCRHRCCGSHCKSLSLEGCVCMQRMNVVLRCKNPQCSAVGLATLRPLCCFVRLYVCLCVCLLGYIDSCFLFFVLTARAHPELSAPPSGRSCVMIMIHSAS